MTRHEGLFLSGFLTLKIQAEHLDKVKISISENGLVKYYPDGKTAVVYEPNGFVSGGLNLALDRLCGIGSPAAIGFIGVSNSTSSVTVATTFLNGGVAGAAANTIILPISPAFTSTGLTRTAGATFTSASFTAGVFIINKVGFLNTSTDAGTGLIDVIGGTGGSDPFSRTFSVDFTNAGSFTLIPQISISAINSKATFPTPL